jgi:hypothetical protein
MKDTWRRILDQSRPHGWVVEPLALELLGGAGLAVADFAWVRDIDEAAAAAARFGYPVVAKVVSPAVLHKSEVNGVEVDIANPETLGRVFERFAGLEGFDGMVVAEMVAGVELIVGARIDYQFGPVVLVGLGGITAELFRDTRIRMAPLGEADVAAMLAELQAAPLLTGFRGRPGVDMQGLRRLLLDFSGLVVEMADEIESIDLNPVICNPERCVVADARIMLTRDEERGTRDERT